MSNSGFILLYRDLTSWEWYKDITTKTLFIHCILRANYEDENWRGIFIERGSFVTSLDNLALETGLTVRQVRTSLDKLKRKRNGKSELTVMSNRKFTFITVNNYEKFQTKKEKPIPAPVPVPVPVPVEQTEKKETTDKKFSPDSIEVMEFCKDYKELKNPVFRASFRDKVRICETLNQEGCYDKEYWEIVFKRSTLGWKYSNGDIIPITLEKMLDNHSAIFNGEIKLAKPKPQKESLKPFRVEQLSEEEQQKVDDAFKNFQEKIKQLRSINYGTNSIKPFK